MKKLTRAFEDFGTYWPRADGSWLNLAHSSDVRDLLHNEPYFSTCDYVPEECDDIAPLIAEAARLADNPESILGDDEYSAGDRVIEVTLQMDDLMTALRQNGWEGVR